MRIQVVAPKQYQLDSKIDIGVWVSLGLQISNLDTQETVN